MAKRAGGASGGASSIAAHFRVGSETELTVASRTPNSPTYIPTALAKKALQS